LNAKFLRIEHVKKYFPFSEGIIMRKTGYVKAVDDVSLDISEGETFALVGESGSGKTTLGKVIVGLYAPTEGTILFQGQDISGEHSKAESVELHRAMQMVFQDPTSSLNPRRRIVDIVSDPMIVHKRSTRDGILRNVRELLQLVELPQDFMYRYPHMLSGGQRQRVGIARALSLDPKFVVLDEPTSSLDVSVQAKIIVLLRRLQEELGLTYLFITHNLRLVRSFASKVGVMYLGKLVEVSPTAELFKNPCHPYTQALLSEIPTLTDAEEKLKPSRTKLEGEIPSPTDAPSGCVFRTRCRFVTDMCKTELPKQIEVSQGHIVACRTCSRQG
jgi:oligopeptide transport system ATP-binding protein